jgi:hypothetical protein
MQTASETPRAADVTRAHGSVDASSAVIVATYTVESAAAAGQQAAGGWSMTVRPAAVSSQSNDSRRSELVHTATCVPADCATFNLRPLPIRGIRAPKLAAIEEVGKG